jgi:predicted transposase/invertase (TIGR01784 family)
MNPFNPKEAFDDKLSILDVKARDESGRQFNIEMQMLGVAYYAKRILYYDTKLYQQQLHQGQDYLELKPAISISFLDHVLFPQTPDHHLHFQLLEKKHHFPLTEDLEFHILELPKFTKSAVELTSGLDIWLYFLRYADKMDTEDLPKALTQYPLALLALEELKMLAQTDQERERYESRRKAQLDYNTGVKVARMEGRDEGRLEGRLEGRDEGRVEEKVGVINFCERLLKRAETPREQLASLTFEQLNHLANDLQAQLLKQH